MNHREFRTYEAKPDRVRDGLWLLTKIVFMFALLFAFAGLAHCQDIRVNCSNTPTCTLATNLAWSNGNQNFIFQPQYVSESIAIYIRNRNTTNAHTSQAVTVWQTGNPDTTLQLSQNADSFVQDNVTQNPIVGASLNNVNAAVPGTPGASGMGFGYISSMFAAQVVIRITSAATQAGSPDTFDLFVVQDKGYVAGPQPGGDDTSSGGGIQFIGQAFSAGSVVSFRSLQCVVGGITNTACLPTFAIGLGSSPGKAPWVDATTTSSATGIGLADVSPLLAQQQVSQSGFNIASQQSSANATLSQNATGSTLAGVAIVTGPAGWTVPVQATTASQCSASLAANATTRHCAVGVDVCVSDTAAQVQLFANLRDGATGAGTIKWNVLLDGVVGSSSCVFKEFNAPICGTINTAMTLELGAATAANNGCTTTLRGYDVL